MGWLAESRRERKKPRYDLLSLSPNILASGIFFKTWRCSVFISTGAKVSRTPTTLL